MVAAYLQPTGGLPVTEPRTVAVTVRSDVTPDRVRELADMVGRRVGPVAAGLLAAVSRALESPAEPADPDVIHLRVDPGWDPSRIRRHADHNACAPVMNAVADALEAQRPVPIEPGVYLVLPSGGPHAVFAEFKDGAWHRGDGSTYKTLPNDARKFSVLEKIGERSHD